MLGWSEGRGVKERKKESTTPTPSRNQKQERKRRKGMNSTREKQRLRTYFDLHICFKDSCPACRKKKFAHCFSSMSSTKEQVLYPSHKI
jgi:hypothetical protein